MNNDALLIVLDTILGEGEEISYADLDRRFLALMGALGISDADQDEALGYWYKAVNHDPKIKLKPLTATEYLAFLRVVEAIQKGQTLQ